MSFLDMYKSVLKEYPDVMSVEEASKAVGVSDKTVYRLLRENKIEHIMMGRKYRIPKAHLFLYLRLCSKESEKT